MYKRQEMNRTAYLPLRQFKKEEIVPTVKADYLRKGKVLQGYVPVSYTHLLQEKDSVCACQKVITET